MRAAQYDVLAAAVSMGLLAGLGTHSGWPRNDTLRRAYPQNTQPPRRDKGTHYVFDKNGTRRVASS